MASSGYAVFAMDYPGFGLSEGLHCFIPSFDGLVDDVIEHYSKIKGNLPILPSTPKSWNSSIVHCVLVVCDYAYFLVWTELRDLKLVFTFV